MTSSEAQDDASTTESSEKVTVPAEWRPIESAPHEELVLLFCRTGDDCWQEVGQASHGRRVRMPDGCVYSSISYHGYATHWMPLPLAPDSSLTFSNESVSDAVQLNQTSLLSSSDTEVE